MLTEWRKATIIFLQNKTNRTECGNYRGISLVAHACKLLLTVVANRPSESCKRENILPEEKCGFRLQQSTIGMIFVIWRLYQLAPQKRNPLYMCFVDASKAHDSGGRVLLQTVFDSFGMPPNMLSVIRYFHDEVRARLRSDDGECLDWFGVGQALR